MCQLMPQYCSPGTLQCTILCYTGRHYAQSTLHAVLSWPHSKCQTIRPSNQYLQEGRLIPLGKLSPVVEAPEVGASILGNCSSVSASTGDASETSIHEGTNKTWHSAAPSSAQSQPSLIAIPPASNLQAHYDSHTDLSISHVSSMSHQPGTGL